MIHGTKRDLSMLILKGSLSAASLQSFIVLRLRGVEASELERAAPRGIGDEIKALSRKCTFYPLEIFIAP